MLKVRVPGLGDLRHVEVIEVLAAVGAEVAAEAVLLQLESDRAVMEITAPQAGRPVELTAGKEDKVTPGQLVARLVFAEVAAIPFAPAAAGRCYAGPAARRLARELGVDIAAVPSGGARGRVLPADVKAHVRNGRLAQARPVAAVPAPLVPGGATEAGLEKHGPVDFEPLPRIQKISGRRLAASWATVPHVAQHNGADITALEALRLERKAATEARGLRLTLLAFLLRAAGRKDLFELAHELGARFTERIRELLEDPVALLAAVP